MTTGLRRPDDMAADANVCLTVNASDEQYATAGRKLVAA